MVQISSGEELEVEGSGITKRSGGGKEETEWLADRSGAAFVTSVLFIYGASGKGSQLVLTARPITRVKSPGFPTFASPSEAALLECCYSQVGLVDRPVPSNPAPEENK